MRQKFRKLRRKSVVSKRIDKWLASIGRESGGKSRRNQSKALIWAGQMAIKIKYSRWKKNEGMQMNDEKANDIFLGTFQFLRSL